MTNNQALRTPASPASDVVARLRAIQDRLSAPAYWMSGSSEGHEGENAAPFEAAVELEEIIAALTSLKASALPSGDGWQDIIERVFDEEIVRQSERLGTKPVDTESLGTWMMRTRKAALLEALKASSLSASPDVGEEDAVKREMLETLCQYESDLIYPPTGDSLERRLARVRSVIGKAGAGEG